MKLLPPLIWACTSLLVGYAQPAFTQNHTDYRVTYIEVADSATPQAIDLLTSYVEASEGAHGNRYFQALQRLGRPNHFAVLEIWDSAVLRSAHADSDSAVRFRDALEPSLLSPPDSRFHSDLFTATGGDIGPDGVFVVTHVDVYPPHTDATVALLDILVVESLSEPGNARFDVWSVIDHPNHMTMVEAWESVGARERHSTAAHTRAFRSGLSPFNGALYDERLYRAL